MPEPAIARVRPAPRLRVGLILQDQFTLNAFAGFVDCLRLAADRGGRSRKIDCHWEIMGDEPVEASCGMRVQPSVPYLDPDRFDYVAVSGGNGYLDPGDSSLLHAYLCEAAAADVRLIGLCTGTFVLARAGLMAGYKACVHWNVYDHFRAEFPSITAVSDRLFMDAGGRISCAGSTGATDLALHLVRRHCGPDKAAQAARHMIIQEARPACHPQAHFYTDLSGIADSRVRRAAHFMEQSLNERLTTAAIAAQINVSPRQLERIFRSALGTSPLDFFREIRLRYAGWLLHHTEQNVADVAAECGFADGAHFARAFRARFGVSPRAARSHNLCLDGSAHRAA